ncbi:MAG: glycine zipper family protein [Deltaproteobacteria bacterium]|nr:glycine zipper family protein [Deltaproteobacteria bacterium]
MKISICRKTAGEDRTERIGQNLRRASGALVWISLFLAVLVVSACYPVPYRPIPQSMPGEAAEAPVPSTQVFFYPMKGQTTEQQSRDHYECYNWAVQQTGFDPGQSAIPTDQRVSVVPMPPLGHDTVAFTIAGAVLGALIGGPRHAGGGALIGATGGMMAGAASDSARAEYARQQEEAYAAQGRVRDAKLGEKSAGFRRAMSACLEGRGYTVR